MIAIVFYHGKQPWKWPKSLKQGLWGKILSKIPSSLKKTMLDCKLMVIDTHDKKMGKAIKSKVTQSRGALNILKKTWGLKASSKEELKQDLLLFDNWPGDKDDLLLAVGNYFWSSVPNMTESLWNELEQEAVKKGIFTKGGYMNTREYIKAEGVQEGWQAGRQEGMQTRDKQIVLNMLKEQADTDFICKVTGLSQEEINKLKNGS